MNAGRHTLLLLHNHVRDHEGCLLGWWVIALVEAQPKTIWACSGWVNFQSGISKHLQVRPSSSPSSKPTTPIPVGSVVCYGSCHKLVLSKTEFCEGYILLLFTGGDSKHSRMMLFFFVVVKRVRSKNPGFFLWIYFSLFQQKKTSKTSSGSVWSCVTGSWVIRLTFCDVQRTTCNA